MSRQQRKRGENEKGRKNVAWLASESVNGSPARVFALAFDVAGAMGKIYLRYLAQSIWSPF